jgi:hypothetical protein
LVPVQQADGAVEAVGLLEQLVVADRCRSGVAGAGIGERDGAGGIDYLMG